VLCWVSNPIKDKSLAPEELGFSRGSVRSAAAAPQRRQQTAEVLYEAFPLTLIDHEQDLCIGGFRNQMRR
jgi:hypothetical protein